VPVARTPDEEGAPAVPAPGEAPSPAAAAAPQDAAAP
jgi:hypothetical protein